MFKVLQTLRLAENKNFISLQAKCSYKLKEAPKLKVV